MSKDTKGQTLIVVVFAMLLALSVGVVISTRYANHLKNVVRSDSSTRAVAIAEAAVERILLLPTATLESYIANNNCGANCHLSITGADGASSVADVTLSYIGNSASTFTTTLKTTESTDLNLRGYPNNTALWVCWNATATGEKPSIEALYINGTTGSYAVTNYAYNAVSSTHSENNFSASSANFGYASCFSLAGKTNPVNVRLKSYYADATIYVIPTNSAVLPKQGILITSVGTSGGETKTIKVTKSSSSVPSQFDYVLYQKSNTENLSN